jgi:hypothetical protein
MRSPLSAMLGVPPAVCLLVLALAFAPGCQQGGEPPTDLAAPPDEQDSLSPEELLTQMSTFMASHNDFAFEAFVSYESLQESGQKLHFDMIQRLAVNKPDRLFWETRNDDASIDQAWYSDGRFVMLKQPDNIYGQVDVPNTIIEMIDVVTNDYGMIVPFSDLLASGDEPVFRQDLLDSDYVGLAWVEGGWSHHLAFRNELVDYELWVQAEGDPVPLRLAIIWKLEEGLPGYVARFRQWNFSPVFDESQFRFEAPSGAELIEVLPLGLAQEVEP